MPVCEPWDAKRGAKIIAEHTHLEGATLVILCRAEACQSDLPPPGHPG